MAEELRRALVLHTPGSRAALRGSLASGADDAYSDIDLVWTVPDASFESSVAGVADALAPVAPVESLRRDPDLARSAGRRLFFVTFEGLPLFWRLDLDIRTRSAGDDPEYGLDDPAGRDEEGWSPAASALANAVAAVKALLRDRPDTARALLERGLRRVGAPAGVTGRWREDVLRLAAAATDHEPGTAPLARRVARLAATACPEER
ncbi:hypothetical protein B1H18_25560 [Streptomyces tsukubensis]|uniref:Polymerase nucleotidyl transferase domain-containing protein n=1 Tax=Streptomyces tsukubensis TaxID=83656 RepID=A0A1V4A322_9ACTN|nr:hypothetical protein B1H18_25560 [Streptomyces tsukubensis]